MLRSWIALLAVALSGCYSSQVRLDRAETDLRLPHPLAEGRTTRSDALRDYGEPCLKFSEGAVWTYRLDKGLLPVPALLAKADRESRVWKSGPFSLVLAFDGDLLREYALIRVR